MDASIKITLVKSRRMKCYKITYTHSGGAECLEYYEIDTYRDIEEARQAVVNEIRAQLDALELTEDSN